MPPQIEAPRILQVSWDAVKAEFAALRKTRRRYLGYSQLPS
jgi:hypothetical protein